jgi:hypothetical protein
MSIKAFYSATIEEFLAHSSDEIRGAIQLQHQQNIVYKQTGAWSEQVRILQKELSSLENGKVFFEFLIPRMGRRADAILLYKNIVFVLEFKVGAKKYQTHDLHQTHDYALDLSHFHEGSHNQTIIPILIATEANNIDIEIIKSKDNVYEPIKTNQNGILKVINTCTDNISGKDLDHEEWINSSYKPTPTIIESAQALYAKHDVKDISRHGAGEKNLNKTTKKIEEIIHLSKTEKQKSICFITGVPGAGKTLVGLNIATSKTNHQEDEYAVFLSGNGPLVAVLREALAKNEVARGVVSRIGEARSNVEPFIQNIHHFRDGALGTEKAPIEKIAIFDEAQRAWNKRKTSQRMREKGYPEFDQSEPEFLISIMDRHKDWCVIIALIGGGQEIHDGEAGLEGWLNALDTNDHWNVYYSDKLNQKEYSGEINSLSLAKRPNFKQESCLHLDTSMRSFKAEKLSHMVHHIIGNDAIESKIFHQQIKEKVPIKITRDLNIAKKWIHKQARGNETKGLIASSGAIRLKPDGIYAKNKIDAPIYFLNPLDDIRSCHFLEDVATEFDIQGLELDWCLIAWDADYRYKDGLFEHWKFTGTKWNKRNKEDSKRFLENTYRVLLTRARQGMIIYIPTGDSNDVTRKPEYYNETYNYLISCGIEPLIFDA